MSAYVTISDVSKTIGGRAILRDVSLTVEEGEVVSIIGPSGSGKSSLLRLINHLDAVTSGEITVNGRHVGYRRVGGRLVPVLRLASARAEARIGMVFQHFNLFEHMSALENVCEAPVRVFGVARPEAEREARALLARVGLADHAHKRPFELSGGQQQRVGIARALAIRPNLLLFDEPTSALDPELVKEVLQVIREISHEGKTMIIVTHELSFAAEISDRIVFMDDGRVVETGNARELLAHPKTDRLKLFLSHLQRDGADQSDV